MNDVAALLTPTEQAAPEVWARPADGVYYDLDATEYHAVESMSASGAKKILRSPQHYRLWRDQPSEPTDAMQFGTAVHCGVLEPDAFEGRICIAPKVDKRTTPGKLRWAEFLAMSGGRIVLDQEDYDRARRCIDALLAHPAVSRLLDGAKTEVSVLWTDAQYKVPCKCRYDALNYGGIVDVKTTKDASAEEFGKQAANLLYHVQSAGYWSGHEHILNTSPEFFTFVCVESEEPHAVAWFTVPPVAMMAGLRLWDEALARYKRALELGRWEGYPETSQTLELPRWALRDTY
jgi:hypothetical protein